MVIGSPGMGFLMRLELFSGSATLFLAASVASCGDPTALGLPASPVLADVQNLVLAPACATSGCHDSSAAGDLDLSTEQLSREQLIETTPTNKAARASAWLRVTPGDAETSFLYRKIIKPGLGEGAAMPIGLRLTQPYVDLVERWILQGAL